MAFKLFLIWLRSALQHSNQALELVAPRICKRIMNTSSIPDWARGRPSSSSALASADPVAADPVEVTSEHLAMGDGLIEEHNARDDPSAPEVVLQARTLRETVCSGANGGINAHRFHIRLHDAVVKSGDELDAASVDSVDSAGSYVGFCDVCGIEVSLVFSRGKRYLANFPRHFKSAVYVRN
jgi:hypothetical protein